MKSVLTTIKERKSIRSFSSDPVDAGDLKMIVEAGVWAPNAMNEQKWHFTVVTDPKMLKKMNEACCLAMAQSSSQMFHDQAQDPDYNAFYNAPAVIVMTSAKGTFPSFDAGAAAQTICLAAKSLGYDTCVTNSTGMMFDADPGLKDELGFPADQAFICAIVIGKEKDSPANPFRDRKLDVIQYI